MSSRMFVDGGCSKLHLHVYSRARSKLTEMKAIFKCQQLNFRVCIIIICFVAK